jgi:hypothetical protein
MLILLVLGGSTLFGRCVGGHANPGVEMCHHRFQFVSLTHIMTFRALV